MARQSPTQSVWERGSLAIEGMHLRTGEKPSQASGTFGWAEGRDGHDRPAHG